MSPNNPESKFAFDRVGSTRLRLSGMPISQKPAPQSIGGHLVGDRQYLFACKGCWPPQPLVTQRGNKFSGAPFA